MIARWNTDSKLPAQRIDVMLARRLYVDCRRLQIADCSCKLEKGHPRFQRTWGIPWYEVLQFTC